MDRLDHIFIQNEEQRQRLEQISNLVDSFAVETHRVDAEFDFAYQHIEALRQLGYYSYTVPKSAGGQGISIYELVMYQERIAQGDASIALGVGWHLSVLQEINSSKNWSEQAIAQLNEEVVNKQILVNRAVTERSTGSPTRGGKPQTTATRLPNGSYEITGRKTFTSLSPVLDYFIVTACLGEDIVEFSIPKHTTGLEVEPTWFTMGMRGTASHDIALNQVIVPAEALKQTYPKVKAAVAAPHLLHIPACYLGIALAARKEALKFAISYQPNSLSTPIIKLPHIIQAFGRIELQLQSARHFLYSVASRWDQQIAASEVLIAEQQAVKIASIQTALDVVDQAMRIVGAHSLDLAHPLQRMYRDVRFGLHNPPMEDAVVNMLGRLAIDDAEVYEKELMGELKSNIKKINKQ